MTKSIMIVGVGGQGTLLASRVLGEVLIKAGYDVKLSEVHGMAQRGGSVVTYVKYGEKVYSPIMEKGEADIILSFEQLEAARWVSFLKKGGKLFCNLQKTPPLPVITGAAKYPENIPEKIKAMGVDIITIDALALAEEAGSAKAVNVVLLGLLSKSMEFEGADWEAAIEKFVPAKVLELNLKAFELGRR
ncbi:MAG: indolepyruvate oxidoreductase subunit beta [Firmicutes bacterium]|nr:indolepyruvate oxidoreductase subunit beta [Bacillota bacterium]